LEFLGLKQAGLEALARQKQNSLCANLLYFDADFNSYLTFFADFMKVVFSNLQNMTRQ